MQKISLILPGLFSLLMAACGPADTAYQQALESKQALFGRLQSNLSLPLDTRAQAMPTELLHDIQRSDINAGIAHAEHYAARAPSASELALLKTYVDLLPHAHRTVFAEKVMAIYLVDGFSGAAMSDWVADRSGHTYYYLVLNSALFATSLDDWLSYKENSAFDGASPSIRVHTATKYQALMYALLHEGAHIVDYELGITPYLDAVHRKLSDRSADATAFTNGVWAAQIQPVARFDFQHRNKLNTYGIYPQRGLIPRAELPRMFSQLSSSPFVSFYSATSWNEDLADYVTYHHLQSRLGGSITIELHDKGKVTGRYRPVESALAKQRQKSILVFED